MRIGISTNSFISLIGAFDFLNNLILALRSVALENGIEIYVFISESKKYANDKRMKKLFHKLKQHCFNQIKETDAHPLFPIEGLKFVTYSHDIKRALKQKKIDIFFPHTNPDLFSFSIPSVGYLYDCQHRYYPEFFEPKELTRRDKWFERMIHEGCCLVNAEAVKKDLIRFYQADPKKIYVLPFTPKLNETYLADHSESIQKYHLPKRYFLSSNQFWVHKDHPTLFKAFAELIQDPAYQDVELVCTGAMEDARRPTYIQELKQLLEELKMKEKVHLLGLLPKKEQIEIMKGAKAVIQTTLFEGGPGGGSVWDACALGVPAIISDIPVNLEIKNQARISYFKTKDVSSLVHEMKRNLNGLEQRRPTTEEILLKNKENLQKLGNALLAMVEEVKSQKK